MLRSWTKCYTIKCLQLQKEKYPRIRTRIKTRTRIGTKIRTKTRSKHTKQGQGTCRKERHTEDSRSKFTLFLFSFFFFLLFLFTYIFILYSFMYFAALNKRSTWVNVCLYTTINNDTPSLLAVNKGVWAT